jgi:uncharacterized membrane protein
MGHGAGFELGMMALSLPIIMWWLTLNFVVAFILDIGVVTFSSSVQLYSTGLTMWQSSI